MPQRPPPGSIPGMVPPDVASMMSDGMMQKAQQQKTNIQQAPNQSQSLSQGSNLPGTQQTQAQGFQPQHTPRDMGSIADEAKLAVSDVAEGVASIPQSFMEMLGLKRPPKTPEEISKLRQFHQKWTEQTQEVKAVTDHRIQAERERKKAEEEQKEMMKKQQEEQKKAQDQNGFIPHGKVTGQAALDKMQQDRKGMGGASG